MSAYAAPPAISAGDAAVLADGGNQANAIMRKNQWQDRQWMQKQVAAGEKIKVSGFRIIGQDIYPEETLTALLSDYQGKELSFSDLQKGADRITSFFRNHGYIVGRAVIPQQDITDGTVTYQVEVERFDALEIINHTKIKDTAIQHQAQAIREGEYVTRERLERAVWLVSDMVDARVGFSLGKNPGTVHVALTVDPYETKHGLVMADNYGSQAMGYNEYGINYDFINPNLYGDHFMAGNSTSGRHMFNWGVNYRTPLSRDGLNLLAGYNVFSYDMGDEWEIYDGVGTSRDWGSRHTPNHGTYADSVTIDGITITDADGHVVPADANYDLTMTGSILVNKAKLTIDTDGNTREYGQAAEVASDIAWSAHVRHADTAVATAGSQKRTNHVGPMT